MQKARILSGLSICCVADSVSAVAAIPAREGVGIIVITDDARSYLGQHRQVFKTSGSRKLSFHSQVFVLATIGIEIHK